MEFDEYQNIASETDQFPEKNDQSGLLIPLLGISGESGSLITEYKKYLRDGSAYSKFQDSVSEELGDLLWYIAIIARKTGFSFNDIAEKNLRKINQRWKQTDNYSLFDDEFPPEEQLPRKFKIYVEEYEEDDSIRVKLIHEDKQVGDYLTDNAYEDDGYRFHDVFHLSYATILGWSSVTRKNMGCKRKSIPKVDEVEDGGRASAIEEGLSALIFDYAKSHSFLKNVERVDYELLKTIKNLTTHLEVEKRTYHDWERAILEGYNVWRQLFNHKKGYILGDLIERKISFQCE